MISISANVHSLRKRIMQKQGWGLGCPQQAKRDAGGGGAVIRISEKDILIHCLPKRHGNSYVTVSRDFECELTDFITVPAVNAILYIGDTTINIAPITNDTNRIKISTLNAYNNIFTCNYGRSSL